MVAEHRNPKVAVDAVVVEEGKVVLIRRRNPPFQGMWALPGGFLEYGETAEEGCLREVKEETGLDVEARGLVGVYSDPRRDPRGHTVSVAYLCARRDGVLRGGDDAVEAKWFGLECLPGLAFDHSRIISDSLRFH